MIVPLAAGSAVDNAARILAQKMGQNMGQAIVIENLPGAAGLIGADKVAKAAPDGYTLGGFNDSIMTMLPHLQTKMPWDILRDFEPVSLVATVEWGLVVPADAPQRSAADLIASARKDPGKINYSSGGNGSPQHIAMALVRLAGGRDDDACAVQGRHPGRHGRGRQRGARRVPGDRHRQLAGALGQGAADRRHHAAAHAAVPGRAHGGAIGPARFRVQFLVRRDGAGRNAQDHRARRCTRRSSRPWPIRKCATSSSRKG